MSPKEAAEAAEAARLVATIARRSGYNKDRVTNEEKDLLRKLAAHANKIARHIRNQFDFRATWRQLKEFLSGYGWSWYIICVAK